MVVAVILGVVNDVTPDPPDNVEPPTEVAYQSIVTPGPTVAEIFAVPEPQRTPDVPAGADGIALTVAVTAALVAETQFVEIFLASA